MFQGSQERSLADELELLSKEAAVPPAKAGIKAAIAASNERNRLC